MGTASYISYHTINGRISSGACTTTSKFECGWDALGSVVRTTQYNSPNGSSRRYAAYGTPLQQYNYYSDFRMGWVGSFGYRRTVNPHAEQYVRARHYSYTDARWTTREPLWPNERSHGYCHGDPITETDPSGHFPYEGRASCFDLPNVNIVNHWCSKPEVYQYARGAFCNQQPGQKACPRYLSGMTAAWPNVIASAANHIRQKCSCTKWAESKCHYHQVSQNQPKYQFVQCGESLRVTFKHKNKFFSISVTIIDAGPPSHPTANALIDLNPEAARQLSSLAGIRWTGCINFALDSVKIDK